MHELHAAFSQSRESNGNPSIDPGRGPHDGPPPVPPHNTDRPNLSFDAGVGGSSSGGSNPNLGPLKVQVPSNLTKQHEQQRLSHEQVFRLSIIVRIINQQ